MQRSRGAGRAAGSRRCLERGQQPARNLCSCADFLP